MSTTQIATFRYRHEAELAASFLAAQGIEAIIMADDEGGAIPGLIPTRLLVRIEDAAHAREVLDSSDAEPG